MLRVSIDLTWHVERGQLSGVDDAPLREDGAVGAVVDEVELEEGGENTRSRKLLTKIRMKKVANCMLLFWRPPLPSLPAGYELIPKTL